MPARQLFPKVNLKIRGVDFVDNLIVLESKGIDVILGIEYARCLSTAPRSLSS
jgi:hypothetical protein